ncbi:hypothetical protein O3G_MSEX015037 [Manduca sexta]|uniref:DNA repair protein complementing XP-C cells homolog n=1 Tax=Manduca sexta TaxID=7130 RepID=A0A921ZXG1_MANSE|nr:hypothetical protein O3G_MSEX015037 [Manduca sexta]
MMMKRKLNRVKKEYQVYMHKVHVLCWLGHGNYVSRVLNNQEIMSAALSLVPSKECYPGERVDLKYIEQITSWFKDKLTLKQDPNEDKFKPKAPPLIEILLSQIKRKVATSKKYMVFIFVALLRALGLQCRVIFNFVTLPLKPPTSELCSLSTKPTEKKKDDKSKENTVSNKKKATSATSKTKSKEKVAQLDGSCDIDLLEVFKNIIQLDGSNDDLTPKSRSLRSTRANKGKTNDYSNENEGISPPKKTKRNPVRFDNDKDTTKPVGVKLPQRGTRNLQNKDKPNDINTYHDLKKDLLPDKALNPKENNLPGKKTQLSKTNSRNNKAGNTANTQNTVESLKKSSDDSEKQIELKPPKITVTNESNAKVSSIYFEGQTNAKTSSRLRLSRKRTHSADSNNSQIETKVNNTHTNKAAKLRTKSAPGTALQVTKSPKALRNNVRQTKTQETSSSQQRINHRDLMKSKTKAKNDVTGELIDIITNSIKQETPQFKKGIGKSKLKIATSEPEDSDSDDNFKPTKLSPKPSTSKVIDRRVISSDEDTCKKKTDVWCEIFVEELEQWICVDIIAGKIHDSGFLYNRSTHPVCYVVGWDNNNYLKDLTRRYVPHWNTVTRKLRAEQPWWNKSLQPWLGPKTARDREEDEFLDKQQLDAPLPKSIAEYKNHPLYALKRHLLKFEAIYPPEAASLGFVRGEPVYARDCVYVCRSRDTWLKEAKVVRLGEKPYKVVKARPKWDKSSNKLITDKPLEVFGPWQVQDYEPPVAENGIVPRNAYGNVELFKQCMLPKGTVHIKLPGLNKVARKLNIDCAPAMTGFEFNGGWSHPVYDGFVVCKEFEEVITEAWVADQEEQEKREREKTDARVYGNWKKLIKGLLIRERIKNKYGFENPSTSQANKNKTKTPRFVAKKK